MQSYYPECFAREMGCTEAEWLGWLPKAMGNPLLQLEAGTTKVRVGDGVLRLAWEAAEPRAIGLIRIPVLRVSFRFAAVDDQQRHAFMTRFDLYMQRGGG
jgi:hypothetical protein